MQEAATVRLLESAPHYALASRFERLWCPVHGNSTRIHAKALELQQVLDGVVGRCDASSRDMQSFTTELVKMDSLNDQLAMYPGQLQAISHTIEQVEQLLMDIQLETPGDTGISAAAAHRPGTAALPPRWQATDFQPCRGSACSS
eukprot:GGOE01020394.1.p2 GENE.GGOE01020394.1~~GGOE01020394.1.p2  ORF type:complete len:145 (-),score=60.29 GGOE01020394.1:292-726(-)